MKLLLPIEFFPPHQQSFFRIYPTDGITRRNRRGLAWQGSFCSPSKKKRYGHFYRVPVFGICQLDLPNLTRVDLRYRSRKSNFSIFLLYSLN